MNECSFNGKMSKKPDDSKIERIRNAAVSIISRRGIANSSVAEIAKEAGVSAGYLYMHYQGKDALINDLLRIHFNVINEKISALIETGNNMNNIVEGVVRHLIDLAIHDKEKIKFIIMLINDFPLEINPELTEGINDLTGKLSDILKNNPSVRDDLVPEDIFLSLIGIPMQYIALRYNRMIQSDNKNGFDYEHIIRSSRNIIFKNELKK